MELIIGERLLLSMLNNNIFCIHIIYVMKYNIYMISIYIYTLCMHHSKCTNPKEIALHTSYIFPTPHLSTWSWWSHGCSAFPNDMAAKKAAAACDSLKSLWSLWTVETSDFRRFKNGLRGNTWFQYDLQVSTVKKLTNWNDLMQWKINKVWIYL